MSRPVEVEARWISLDPQTLERKLTEVGATKVGDFFYREWIFLREGWGDVHRRIRVRTDGTQTWLTYKANATWEIDSTEEVEVTVSSADDVVALLQAADIPLARYQEKKRTRYVLDDLVFELDYWPRIPMVFEIEAPSGQRIQEAAALLGLDWGAVLFEDQKLVHEKFYGIDLNTIDDYRFA